MKRVCLKESNLNPHPHFIGSWMIETHSICDALINYFESHPGKQLKGLSEAGRNLDVKNSTDLSITPNDINLMGNEILMEYIDRLYECHKDYLEQWPFLGTIANNLEIGDFNLQRYQAGEHFQQIHTERSGIDTLHRVLAWMTYLNDVDDGGSTYFSHYDIEVQPKRGLTLIWPAEWTHAHKGNVLRKGSKYIITGWMHFPSASIR